MFPVIFLFSPMKRARLGGLGVVWKLRGGCGVALCNVSAMGLLLAQDKNTPCPYCPRPSPASHHAICTGPNQLINWHWALHPIQVSLSPLSLYKTAKGVPTPMLGDQSPRQSMDPMACCPNLPRLAINAFCGGHFGVMKWAALPDPCIASRLMGWIAGVAGGFGICNVAMFGWGMDNLKLKASGMVCTTPSQNTDH